MCNYYISDLHFHHPKAIDMDERPFTDLEDMHQQLISKWNKKVSETDTVYILGDFSFCKQAEIVNELLKMLKGKKILIRGNHDYFLDKEGFDKDLFEGIYDYLRIVDLKQRVILCHYPIAVWDCSHWGSIHLYGHVHGNAKAEERHPHLKYLENAYNVGCMNWGYEPVSLEEILGKQGCV